ncbi:MAG: MFS transporter, partial [bacterium]|nr:MFS transporter [bacterium]
VLLPLLRGFNFRLSILFGIAASALRAWYVPYVDLPHELYLYAVISGLQVIFFWIPYEILYFHGHDTKIHGRQSAAYFSIFSGAGIVMPVLSGFIADHFGFRILFGIGSGLMFIPFLFAFQVPKEYIRITLVDSLRHLKGVMALFIFDGIFWSIAPGLVALSLLNFTQTAVHFGAVNSFVALGALFVSLFAARLSDRLQNRGMVIYPVSILSALLLIALGRQQSFYVFTVLFLIFTSLRTIAQPINNALPMDLRHDHAKLYMGRQFLLSIGRVLGFGLTWLSVLTFGLFPMYVAYAVGYLLYTLVVRLVLRAPSHTVELLPSVAQ